METVDSYFHRSPAVSSIAARPREGGKRAVPAFAVFHGIKDTVLSLVYVLEHIVWRGFILSEWQKKKQKS